MRERIYTHTDQLQRCNPIEKRIVVVGGAPETGKTTMLETVRKKYGQHFRYVTDPLPSLLGGAEFEDLDRATKIQVLLDCIGHHIARELEADSRLTISDGSLIEIDALSRGVFTKYERFMLDSLLRHRDWKGVYQYIKLPPQVPQEDEYKMIIDKNIEEILRNGHDTKTLRIPKEVSDFRDRYKWVMRFIQRVDNGRGAPSYP